LNDAAPAKSSRSISSILSGKTHRRAKRHRRPTPPERRRGRTFRVAADLLGSRAEYRDLSVYDLDPCRSASSTSW
jgi:hypothetical protein